MFAIASVTVTTSDQHHIDLRVMPVMQSKSVPVIPPIFPKKILLTRCALCLSARQFETPGRKILKLIYSTCTCFSSLKLASGVSYYNRAISKVLLCLYCLQKHRVHDNGWWLESWCVQMFAITSIYCHRRVGSYNFFSTDYDRCELLGIMALLSSSLRIFGNM